MKKYRLDQESRIIVALLVIAAIALLMIAIIVALPVIMLMATINIVAMPQSTGNSIAKTFVDNNYKKRLKKYVKSTNKLFNNYTRYGKRAMHTNNLLACIVKNDAQSVDERIRILYCVEYCNRENIVNELIKSISPDIPEYTDKNYGRFYILSTLPNLICDQVKKCIVNDYTYTKKDGAPVKIRKGSKVSKVINAMIKDDILQKNIDIKKLYTDKQYFLITNLINDVFKQSAILTDNNELAYTSCHCYFDGLHAAGALSTAYSDNCYCIYLMKNNVDISRLFYDIDYLPAIGRMSLLVNDTMIVYNGKVYGTFSSNFERVIDIYAKEFFDTDNLEYSEPRSYNVINYTEHELPYDDFACNCIMIKPAHYANNTRVNYGIDLYDNDNNMIDDASRWIASENKVSCAHCSELLDTDYDDIYQDNDGYYYCAMCFDTLFTYCNCERLVERDNIIIIDSVNADCEEVYCSQCVPSCNVCGTESASGMITLVDDGLHKSIYVCQDCLDKMQTNCIVCNTPVVRHHRAINYYHHHNYSAMPVHVHTHCVNGLANVLTDVSRSGNLIQSN